MLLFSKYSIKYVLCNTKVETQYLASSTKTTLLTVTYFIIMNKLIKVKYEVPHHYQKRTDPQTSVAGTKKILSRFCGMGKT